MKLVTSFLRPAIIREVCDEVGTVKVACPGLFSPDDDLSLLPEVIPYCQVHASGYSSPMKDETVWLFHDTSNTQLFFYLRLQQIPDSVRNLLHTNKQAEIIFSRDTDEGQYQMYFIEGEGVKLHKDGSVIQIHSNGDIELSHDSGDTNIYIKNKDIFIGDPNGNKTEAVRYSGLLTYMKQLETILSTLATVAGANMYTSPLAPVFTQGKIALQQMHAVDATNDIKSKVINIT